MNRYFLSARLGGEIVEREVSLAEFCAAERNAGFRPKMNQSDPRYKLTPATGGFSNGSISGRIELIPSSEAQQGGEVSDG